MPDFKRLHSLAAAVLILAAAGCRPAPDPSQAWRRVSLLSGPEVRVRVFRKVPFNQLEITLPDQGVAVVDAAGNWISRPNAARKLYLRMADNLVMASYDRSPAGWAAAVRSPTVAIQSVNNQVNIFRFTIPAPGINRDYEATQVKISVKFGSLAAVSSLPLELYLARVLPAEMDPEHFTLEVLKAQAVVARTWALMNQTRHGRFGYHFCDGPHCQVYRGRKGVSRRAEQAVKMTAGEVLTFKGKLAEAFYHSTCGGNTAYIHDVWGGARLPYLLRVEDHWKAGNRPYCARSPYAQWRVFMSLRQVERGLRREKRIGQEEKLEALQVDYVNPSGRVKRLLVTTDIRRMHLTTDAFRQLFDPEFSERKLLSNFFEIDAHGNQLLIRGRGLGHGVGMCQWGARGMAQHGFSYQEILTHYFQGTRIGRHYGTFFKPVVDPESTTHISQAGE